MKTSDFAYDLPPELIAQTPIPERDRSRLMCLDKKTGALEHRHFYELPTLLQAGDCLVINDSRVLPARLLGRRPTGGVSELVLLRDLGDNIWECLCRPGKHLREGAEILFGEGELRARIEEVLPDGNRRVRFFYEGIFLEVLDRLGKMPLPPYIKEELQDRERYQTVYSRELGSAAAPTAGLHFTRELLDEIREMGVTVCPVTLHVGLGTFRPGHRRRDHLVPHAGELCGRRRPPEALVGLDGHLHLSRLPLSLYRRPDHELPPAGEHADHAGLGPGGTRAGPERLPRGGGRAIPLLQLRRRHVHRITKTRLRRVFVMPVR